MDLIENSLTNPLSHWYYKHKFYFINKVFINHKEKTVALVDIGAGSALFSKELIRTNLVNSVVAVDTGYEKNYFDKDDQILYAQSASYAEANYFLLTDVLEHVENDLDFLHSIVSEANNNSRFIITVPALNCLWSGHDVYLKHFRRYTKKQLISLVENSGLQVWTVRYTYSTVFLMALIQRKIAGKSTASQMKQNNWFVSKLLELLLIPDRRLSFLPFGVSLFLVATKENNP